MEVRAREQSFVERRWWFDVRFATRFPVVFSLLSFLLPPRNTRRNFTFSSFSSQLGGAERENHDGLSNATEHFHPLSDLSRGNTRQQRHLTTRRKNSTKHESRSDYNTVIIYYFHRSERGRSARVVHVDTD